MLCFYRRLVKVCRRWLIVRVMWVCGAVRPNWIRFLLFRLKSLLWPVVTFVLCRTCVRSLLVERFAFAKLI